jgi:hypothetical protein
MIKKDPMRVIFRRPNISVKCPEKGATEATASVLQTGIQVEEVNASPPRSAAMYDSIPPVKYRGTCEPEKGYEQNIHVRIWSQLTNPEYG